jgi:hypothetical protein
MLIDDINRSPAKLLFVFASIFIFAAGCILISTGAILQSNYEVDFARKATSCSIAKDLSTEDLVAVLRSSQVISSLKCVNSYCANQIDDYCLFECKIGQNFNITNVIDKCVNKFLMYAEGTTDGYKIVYKSVPKGYSALIAVGSIFVIGFLASHVHFGIRWISPRSFPRIDSSRENSLAESMV